MAAATLTLDAPAKLNLALAVGSPEPDARMHPIVSWMVALDFHDSVQLRRLDPQDHAADPASSLTIAFAPDAPRPEPIDWPTDKDLAWRAMLALEARVGRRLPTAIEIDKRIPTGAGLGGGSSDAAAVLVGLNDLWRLGLDTATLAAIASQLGSDVPFLVHAIRGEPSMIAAGYGESLRPAPLTEPVSAVLVLPDCKCPTGPVYRALDDALAGLDRPADASRVEALVASQPLRSGGGLFNDLADPAMQVVPTLRDAAKRLALSVGDSQVMVSGSGSTLYVVTESATRAAELAEAWRADGLVTVAATTLNR